MRQRQDQELPLRKFQEIIESETALAFFDPFDVVATLAPGEKLAEPAVSRAVARIDQDVGGAVDKDNARTDQKLWLVGKLGIVEFLVGAHDACEGIVIGNPDRRKTQKTCLMNIGPRIRAAAQEGEIGGD